MFFNKIKKIFDKIKKIKKQENSLEDFEKKCDKINISLIKQLKIKK